MAHQHSFVYALNEAGAALHGGTCLFCLWLPFKMVSASVAMLSNLDRSSSEDVLELIVRLIAVLEVLEDNREIKLNQV